MKNRVCAVSTKNISNNVLKKHEVLKEVNGKLVKCKVEVSEVKMDLIIPAILFNRLNNMASLQKEAHASIVMRAIEKELSIMEKTRA